MNLFCAFVVQLVVILAVNGEQDGNIEASKKLLKKTIRNYDISAGVELRRCPLGDTSCIKDVANFILREKSHGVSELNLIDLNPLQTDEIVIKGGKGGKVDVDVRFSKSFITGLQNVYVETIR